MNDENYEKEKSEARILIFYYTFGLLLFNFVLFILEGFY